jgi:hypothetical protein
MKPALRMYAEGGLNLFERQFRLTYASTGIFASVQDSTSITLQKYHIAITIGLRAY